MILPFPLFLIGLRSLSWPAVILWAGWVGLRLARTNIRPNPALNPLDQLGAHNLCPSVAVQLADLLARKKRPRVAPE